MSTSVVTREQCFPADRQKEDVVFFLVLQELCEGSRTEFGVLERNLFYVLQKWKAEVRKIIDELISQGIVITEQHQVGTGGDKGTFYRFVKSPIEVSIRLKPQEVSAPA